MIFFSFFVEIKNTAVLIYSQLNYQFKYVAKKNKIGKIYQWDEIQPVESNGKEVNILEKYISAIGWYNVFQI